MKNSSEIKAVEIAKLITENLQIRVEMKEENISDYASVFSEKPGDMPPVIVFHDDKTDRYYLADGFHRVAAVMLNGGDTIMAEVRPGTFDDALRMALIANAKNGIKRTNADKRHALEVAWANWRTLLKGEPLGETEDGTKTGLPSARQIAEICGVSHDTASKFINLKGVSDSDTPPSATTVGEATSAPQTSDKRPDALITTKDHLEERNASVKKMLAAGKDRFGIVIPEHLKDAFLSREPQRIIRELGKQRKVIEEHFLAGDVAFAQFASFALRDLETVIRDIRHGVAFCVCRMCRGRGCGSCSELGFQTRPQYDRNPTEFKSEEM